MEPNLIGIDVWNCCGCELTPRMRRDILMTAVEMYDSWETEGTSYNWDSEVGTLTDADASPVATLGEFLIELTGERHPFDRWDFLSYHDELYDRLKDYLCGVWGDDAYEEDDEGEDPMLIAECRVFKWLSGLKIDEVVAWRADLLKADSWAKDWRTIGF